MASTKVICWNSAGLRANTESTRAKMAFFDSKFPNGKFEIAAFIETHHKDDDDLPEELGQYKTSHNVLHTPTHMETHGGIIILISKDYTITSRTEAIPGRLLNVKYTHKTFTVERNLSIFYGLQWKKYKKKDIEKVLEKFNFLHDINTYNIILGDFNFVETDLDKGKNMDQRDKLVSNLWESIKSKNGLVDPYRVQYPKKICYSFIATTGKSRGDRTYISEDNINSVTKMEYIHTHFGSAHKIMSLNIKEEQNIGKSYWKMNSSILDDEQYKKAIEEAIRGIDELDINNDLDRWDLIILVIRSITKKYAKQKSRIKNAVKKYVLKELQELEKKTYDTLTVRQKEQYHLFKQRFKQITEDEIEGHLIRTRGHPRYEINEPDIDFYAKLEKRSQKKNIISELEDKNGCIYSENEEMIKIAEEYYTQLYTPAQIDSIKQQQLLKNIVLKISTNDKNRLDAPITEAELAIAVQQLQDNKSPGIDGITAEFYKKYWYLIKDNYLKYINTAKNSAFREHRNTSVTTIIYKHKGVIYRLENYRPISLINVDLKILTKTLTNRLKPVLPTIIHRSQTGIPGRRIDHTIHMIRDLIDLINEEDTQAAFIFFDQEKAFDRVDHDFLYKAMEAFGFGGEFIKWIKVLYSNAATKIKVNGYLSGKIYLKRGARQGCPLSMLLYAIVIEVLALQLRANQNIVGFQVGGEKIISLHYADDTTITITQNRCFKEVIKDINIYEQATGAKINYSKTKGLWLGKWKGRLDKPIDIEWTSENVKNLGVYFGNKSPEKHTFQEIMPKIKKSLNYWKQFKLSTFAKSRVIEIFHASRLWYAATYYNIPPDMKKQLQKYFLEYIIYPHSSCTISQQEMQKLREDGGAKLIDIQCKTDASKVKWLMDLVINPDLETHRHIIRRLLGKQKGSLQGIELFFTTTQYATRILKTQVSYYKNAIKGITKLNIRKKIDDVNEEKLFYNPTFKTIAQLPLTPNMTCIRNNAFTYGEIRSEYEKQQSNQQHNRHIANVYPRIIVKDLDNRNDHVFYHTKGQKYINFQETTHKMIYQELLQLNYKEHHSKAKWEERFPNQEINWEKVWNAVNNQMSSEDTKTTIWEQIHLNDYTTYSYNKWHGAQQKCPFCNEIPDNKFHITLECTALQVLWSELEPHLQKIHHPELNNTEKVFGTMGSTPNIILRNWITFLLRQCIVEQENIAFHNKKGNLNIMEIKIIFNQRIKTELWNTYNIYKHLGRLSNYTKFFGVNNYLIREEKDKWNVLTLYKTH